MTDVATPPATSATSATSGGSATAAPPWDALDRATADLDPPFAVVDLAAFDANADALVRRAGGYPVRVATKSVRCRALVDRALARDGFAGVLAYTLAEALALAQEVEDVVVGYPTVDRAALRDLAADDHARARVALVVDDEAHLDLVVRETAGAATPVRVCLDVDASLRLAGGRVHLGVRRSPVHTPEQAATLARAVVARPGLRLVGVLSYEAQVAGVGDDPANPLAALAVRAVHALSERDLQHRRGAVVAAVAAVAPLELVNAGGTGSLERTARIGGGTTDVAAGSGLFGPALFDRYRAFAPRPAALFALPVVRRPAPGVATVASGGWVASGAAGRDRLPVPVHPAGLRLTRAEGAGEVQTPLRGPAADRLAIGDRVWFRHAKAGELCEHVDVLHLVDPGADGSARTTVPTYRGEGWSVG